MNEALQKPALPTRSRRANNDRLLAEIASFCQAVGMAESTFGRHVANDGKLVPRLRVGGRITTQTVERIDAFIAQTLADRGLEATRDVLQHHGGLWFQNESFAISRHRFAG